jgi:hypothetical protein
MTRASQLALHALGLSLTGALLAACSGGTPQSAVGLPGSSQQPLAAHGLPLDLSGRLPETVSSAPRSVLQDRSTSHMSPQTESGDLVYVTGSLAGNAYVFSYPQMVYQGEISGLDFPAGACADSRGNVWIAILGSSILNEYAHGGTTPIASLNDPQEPAGCSVDPSTGNLAVTNYVPSGEGDVAVYQDAQGTPTTYSDPGVSLAFCGYDNSGNLFVDGRTTSGAFQLAELPAGQSTFINLTLSGGTINFPGGVQWNNGYVAVGDQKYDNKSKSAIYEVAVSGSAGQIVRKTVLKGAVDVVQFWIQGKSVVAPDIGLVELRLYRYPHGGQPTFIYTPPPRTFNPYGSAVSLAP